MAEVFSSDDDEFGVNSKSSKWSTQVEEIDCELGALAESEDEEEVEKVESLFDGGLQIPKLRSRFLLANLRNQFLLILIQAKVPMIL